MLKLWPHYIQNDIAAKHILAKNKNLYSCRKICIYLKLPSFVEVDSKYETCISSAGNLSRSFLENWGHLIIMKH